MKKKLTILLLVASFLLMRLSVFAQDSTKPGAVKQLNGTNEQADKLQGKKIQQQSLSKNHFDTLVTADTAKKKTVKKYKHKHS